MVCCARHCLLQQFGGAFLLGKNGCQWLKSLPSFFESRAPGAARSTRTRQGIRERPDHFHPCPSKHGVTDPRTCQKNSGPPIVDAQRNTTEPFDIHIPAQQ